MTKTSKVLLFCSIAGFTLGFSGVLWGIGMPAGAIFFGLFLISKVLEREAALFDCEHRVRLAMAQQAQPSVARSKTDCAPKPMENVTNAIPVHAH